MKLPSAEKLLAFCENNPVLLIFALALAIPGVLLYFARDFVQSPPQSFAIFVGLGVAIMIYAAYLATVALKNWRTVHRKEHRDG